MQKPHKALIAKGEEIIDTVHKIGELIPEDSQELQMIKSYMFADAMTLVAKVHGVAGEDLYDIQMENANTKLDG